MPASTLFTRNRILLAVLVLVLVAAVVAAVVTLRSGADPAGATASAGPTASSGAEGDAEAGAVEGDDAGPDDAQPGDGEESGPAGDAGAGSGPGKDDASEPRETLDPAPFDTEVTPTPGVTVAVQSVEAVTGEANVPGEVGGPALRFTVELTNGTDKVLDLRTVVVNAYYGPDRTPAAPLLKPGGAAFAAEVAALDSARGVFVFAIPPETQGEVELEVDPGVGSPIVIFADS